MPPISEAPYGTQIRCIDGRPVRHIESAFSTEFTGRGIRFFDVVTRPGVIRILAQGTSHPATRSLLDDVEISIEKHHSQLITVVAHSCCAGNPVSDGQQVGQLVLAVDFLADRFPQAEICGYMADIVTDYDWILRRIHTRGPGNL